MCYPVSPLCPFGLCFRASSNGTLVQSQIQRKFYIFHASKVNLYFYLAPLGIHHIPSRRLLMASGSPSDTTDVNCLISGSPLVIHQLLLCTFEGLAPLRDTSAYMLTPSMEFVYRLFIHPCARFHDTYSAYF